MSMARKDPNAGWPWSEVDLSDLVDCVRLRQDAKKTADFLCRPINEVQEKIVELERSGELQRRIAEASTTARH